MARELAEPARDWDHMLDTFLTEVAEIPTTARRNFLVRVVAYVRVNDISLCDLQDAATLKKMVADLTPRSRQEWLRAALKRLHQLSGTNTPLSAVTIRNSFLSPFDSRYKAARIYLADPEAVKLYLLANGEQRSARQTVWHARQCLRLLREVNGEDHLELQSVTAQDLTNLSANLQRRYPVTAAHYLNSFKRLMRWAHEHTDLVPNLPDFPPPIKQTHYARTFTLSPTDWQRCVTACMDTSDPILFITLLFLLKDTAARIRDLFELTRDSVDLVRGSVAFKASKNRQRVEIPLSSESVLWLQRYLATRVVSQGGPLLLYFMHKCNYTVMSRQIRSAFQKHGIRFPKGTLFHAFRHTGATEVQLASNDIFIVSTWLGVAPDTAAQYVHDRPQLRLKSILAKEDNL